MIHFVLLACLVIGGTNGADEEIDITKAPYHVSIKYNELHKCSGALISPVHVLTVAQCVQDFYEAPYDGVTVVTGSDNLENKGTSHKVQSIQWHPKFQSGSESFWNNDIAVITLIGEVELNEKQQPVSLPIAEHTGNVAGRPALVTGFGRIVTKDSQTSPALQGIKAQILTNEECKPFAPNILDNQVCTLQPTDNRICKGDSGGPLVFDERLVGLASWNRPSQCRSGSADVYTNVYRQLDFINSVI